MSETAVKPKIVIDTNTWVEAALATLSPETATPSQLLCQRVTEYALDHFEVILGQATVKEMTRVIGDPQGITAELNEVNRQRHELGLGNIKFFDRTGYFGRISARVPLSMPGKSPTRCEADKYDQMFLDLAFGNDTSLIVTQDRHLLDLTASWCRIIRPNTFCEEIFRDGGAPELSSLVPCADALAGIKLAQQVADKRVARTSKLIEAPAEVVPVVVDPPALFSEPHAKRRLKASFNDPHKQPDKAPEAPPPTALGQQLARVKDKLQKT
jgi:predicted nucleic acid-binding protein